MISKQGTSAFNASFENVLYKMKSNDPTEAIFTGNKLKNINPGFDSIDVGNRYFNYRLKSNSAAINKGALTTGLLFDLDGNNRNIGLPDLGCYEK
jgi:hypothetical protein